MTFSQAILKWRAQYGRSFVWMTGDPYDVWLSEVMLQQTQASTIAKRFPEFKMAFPDIHALASSSLEQVMACWAGLGYYRRASNLHAASKMLSAYVKNHGTWPRDIDFWMSLPGVGKSTAHAIVSACFSTKVSIMDANAQRVILRYLGVPQATDKEKWAYAEKLVLDVTAGEAKHYNQALMDLGSGLCQIKNPSCSSCPLKSSCSYVKKPFSFEKKAKKKSEETWNFYLVQQDDGVYLTLRDGSLWSNLWCLPAGSPRGTPVYSTQHLLTHKKLEIVVYKGDVSDCSGGQFFALADIRAKKVGLPKPIYDFLSTLE